MTQTMRLRTRNLSESPAASKREVEDEAQQRRQRPQTEVKATKTASRRRPSRNAKTPQPKAAAAAAAAAKTSKAQDEEEQKPGQLEKKQGADATAAQKEKEPQTPTRTPDASKAPGFQTERKSSRRNREVPSDNWLQEQTSSPVLTRTRARKLGKKPDPNLAVVDSISKPRRTSRNSQQNNEEDAPQRLAKPVMQSLDEEDSAPATAATPSKHPKASKQATPARSASKTGHPAITTPKTKTPKTKKPKTPKQSEKQAEKQAEKQSPLTTAQRHEPTQSIRKPRRKKKVQQQQQQQQMDGAKADSATQASSQRLDNADSDAPTEVSLSSSRNAVLERLAAEQAAIKEIDDKRRARIKAARALREAKRSEAQAPQLLDDAVLRDLQALSDKGAKQHKADGQGNEGGQHADADADVDGDDEDDGDTDETRSAYGFHAQLKGKVEDRQHVYFDEEEDEEDEMDEDDLGLDDDMPDVDDEPASKRAKDQVVFERGRVKVEALRNRPGGSIGRPARSDTLNFISRSRLGSQQRAPTFRRQRRAGRMAPTFGVHRR